MEILTKSAQKECDLAISKGIDITPYVKIMKTATQLREIRLGLQSNIDVTIYADNVYSASKMKLIRTGLEDGVPMEKYKHLNEFQIKVCIWAFKQNIDLDCFINDAKHTPYDLSQIYNQLKKAKKLEIDIQPFLDSRLSASQISEIIEGIQDGIDVSVYATPTIHSKDMSIIRSALNNGCNSIHLKDYTNQELDLFCKAYSKKMDLSELLHSKKHTKEQLEVIDFLVRIDAPLKFIKTCYLEQSKCEKILQLIDCNTRFERYTNKFALSIIGYLQGLTDVQKYIDKGYGKYDLSQILVAELFNTPIYLYKNINISKYILEGYTKEQSIEISQVIFEGKFEVLEHINPDTSPRDIRKLRLLANNNLNDLNNNILEEYLVNTAKPFSINI